jgi:GMP synthase (glutamine-hydrolysing)
MRRLLVFQHVAHEILGSLDPLLRAAGFRIRYVNFSRQPDALPDISRYQGLVVLGGPMNCDQSDRYPHLHREIDTIQAAIASGKPVLGICLGSQLIARALGARVRKNPVKEIGWYDLYPTAAGRADPLFRRLGDHQKIFQWHGDTFDLPDHAQLLASSPDCRNQAFRYGDNVYGLQFHLEVDAPMIERWLLNAGNQRELSELGNAQVRVAEIQRDTHRYIGESLAIGKDLFGAYIREMHQQRRRSKLPSR